MKIADGPEAHALAAKVFAAGGIIGFRTDTFYGLGVDPFNRYALVKLNELKGREGKPILVVLSDEPLTRRLYANVTELYSSLATHHWPGPLTLIGLARTELPEELTAGTGTVGLRLPDDEAVRALIRACGGALTATSANPAWKPPARSASEVERYFGGGVDLIVDSGETRATLPSTVLDISGERPVLVREGVVSREAISETLRELGVAL
jgi:L-threonylcarbamoyladenylate synthase